MLLKKKIQKAMILALLVSISSLCHAQIKLTSLRVEVFNEMVSMPTNRVIQTPLHPGFIIGADFYEKKDTRWPQTLGVDLGYYYHRLYEHAFMLDAAYSFGYEFKFGLRLKLLANIGYKHSVLSGDVYEFENGEYQESTHWGKAQFNVKAGLGMEYPLFNRYSVSINVKEMIALPYASEKGMPFSTHLLFGVGVKYSLL